MVKGIIDQFRELQEKDLDRKVQIGLRIKKRYLIALRKRAYQYGVSPQAIINILVSMFLKGEIHIEI